MVQPPGTLVATLLTSVPFELFIMICRDLPIVSILALLQVNRLLRHVLIHPNTATFWKTMRTNKGIPKGPESMSDLEWLQYLYHQSSLCQYCKGGYARTNWETLRRWCTTCVHICTRSYARNRLPASAAVYIDYIPTYTDAQNNKRFVREDLNDIVTVARSMPSQQRQTFLSRCHEAMYRQKVWAHNVDNWFCNTVMGWFVRDGITPGDHTLQELEAKHNCYREDTLSVDEWLDLQKETFDAVRTKYTQLFLYDSVGYWPDLRMTMDMAWDTYLRRQLKRIRMNAPHSKTIALFPFMRDVLLFSHPATLDVEYLHRIINDHSDAIYHWLSFLDKRLCTQYTERGHDPALIAYAKQRQIVLPPQPAAPSGLSKHELAITEVYCAQCQNVFSSVAGSIRHINRETKLCFDTWTDQPSMLSLTSGPAGIGLVSVSGLDCTVATCHDMDRLWNAYTCISCLGRFNGTWRECVKHFHKAGHKRNDHDYDFGLLFARVERLIYDPHLPENDKPQWTCNYCSRFSIFPATRTQIEDHVARAHHANKTKEPDGKEYFGVPQDFFYVGS